jgi:hypothetical protein
MAEVERLRIAKGERSLDRNNSVINRKELMKKEYNKIIDSRLPNILSLMNNHEKYNHQSSTTCNNLEGGSIHDLCTSTVGGAALEYDETDLLSKMFTKDHQQNRSGFLHHATEQPTSLNQNLL